MFSIRSATLIAFAILHLHCVEVFANSDTVCGVSLLQQHADFTKPQELKKKESLESQLSSLIRTVDDVVTIVYDFNETAFTMMPPFAKHIDAISNQVLLLKKAVGTYYASDEEAKPAVVSWGTSLVVKLNTTIGGTNRNVKVAFATLSAKSSGLIGKIRRNARSVTDALTAAQEIADKARAGSNELYGVDEITDGIDDTASLLRARSEDKAMLSPDLQLDRSVEQKSGDAKAPCEKAHHLINTAHKDISSLNANIEQLNASLPSLVKGLTDTVDSSLSQILSQISKESAAAPDIIPDKILDALKDTQSRVKDVPADFVQIAFSVMDTKDIDSKTSVIDEPIDKLLGYVKSMQEQTEVACGGVAK